MENTAESRFWDRFIALVRREEVAEKALRWYVRRVEVYIQILNAIVSSTARYWARILRTLTGLIPSKKLPRLHEVGDCRYSCHPIT